MIAAVLAGESQSAAARAYGVSQGWISRLMARYRAEGEAVFEPRSRAARNSPGGGRRAGPGPAQAALGCWARCRRSDDRLAPGTPPSRRDIARDDPPHLGPAGAIVPQPAKRPKSSNIRFAAAQPNECWQSDFPPQAGGAPTHYRLTRPGLLSLFGLREAGHSTVGIVIAALSLLVMPFLSWFERRTGRELGSASAFADSKQTLICTYLSGALLIGLLLNSLLGWACAGSIPALVVAGFAIREGIDAWHGDTCRTTPVSILTGDHDTEHCDDNCRGDCCGTA